MRAQPRSRRACWSGPSRASRIVTADQLPAAKLVVIAQPPFWQMEELGLQNFR
jgi:hypothetical protein